MRLADEHRHGGCDNLRRFLPVADITMPIKFIKCPFSWVYRLILRIWCKSIYVWFFFCLSPVQTLVLLKFSHSDLVGGDSDRFVNYLIEWKMNIDATKRFKWLKGRWSLSYKVGGALHHNMTSEEIGYHCVWGGTVDDDSFIKVFEWPGWRFHYTTRCSIQWHYHNHHVFVLRLSIAVPISSPNDNAVIHLNNDPNLVGEAFACACGMRSTQ